MQPGSGSEMNITQTEVAVRRKLIAGMRKDGLTYTAIGLRLGISGERVRQILNGVVKKKPKPRRVDPPLTTRDVARRLNVHVNTVRRWSKQGILEAYPVGPRGDRRFKREDIDRLFAKRPSS